MLKHYILLLISLVLLGFCTTANAQIITTIAGNGFSGCIGNDMPATDAQLDEFSVLHPINTVIYIWLATFVGLYAK